MTDRDGMYVHVTAKGAMSFRMDCQPMSWLRWTMQPSRPSRNGHPISKAFRFQSWSEVSHAKADGTRPSAIVHDMNAGDHDRRASTRQRGGRSSHDVIGLPDSCRWPQAAPGPVAGNHACPADACVSTPSPRLNFDIN